MVSARSPYENTWDEFLTKLAAFSPRQHQTLLEEATVDPRLAMIDRLARDWVTTNNRTGSIRRIERAARAAEQQRMTPNPDAFRDYVTAETRKEMPPHILHRRSSKQRDRSTAAAREFWKGMDAGFWRGRSVDRFVAAARAQSLALRMLAHPYGPAVSAHEIEALQATHRALRPAVRPTFAPVGISAERALQIAIAALENKRG